jgi:hypothetical protein
VDVEGFFFFFHELGLDSITVGFHYRMVIVNIAARNLRGRRDEIASKRDPFGAYSNGSRVVWSWVVRGERTRGGKTICELAIEPTNEIATTNKKKSENCVSIEMGPCFA